MIGVNSRTFTIDSERLEREQENYESWLEERTESVYQIASIAKSKNLDLSDSNAACFSIPIDTVCFSEIMEFSLLIST